MILVKIGGGAVFEYGHAQVAGKDIEIFHIIDKLHVAHLQDGRDHAYRADGGGLAG